MKIRICADNNPAFRIDDGVQSLSFDLKTGKFKIWAGGYDIGSPDMAIPTATETIGDVNVYRFSDEASALKFHDWIRDASARAQESFFRMMD
jgi:hypothetical protein